MYDSSLGEPFVEPDLFANRTGLGVVDPYTEILWIIQKANTA